MKQLNKTEKLGGLQFICDKFYKNDDHDYSEDYRRLANAFVLLAKSLMQDIMEESVVASGSDIWYKNLLTLKHNVCFFTTNSVTTHRPPNIVQTEQSFSGFAIYGLNGRRNYWRNLYKGKIKSKKVPVPKIAEPSVVRFFETYDGMPNIRTFPVQCQACVDELYEAIEAGRARGFLK